MSIHDDLTLAANELLFGRDVEGARICRRALEDARAEGSRELAADALILLGECLFEQLRYAEVRACFEQALAIRRELLGPDHLATAHAKSCLSAAAWVLDLGPEARALAMRALAAVPAEPLPEDRLVCVRILKNVASLERRLVDREESLRLLRRALALLEAPKAADPLEIASVLVMLGMAEQASKHHRAARPYFERALALRRRALGEEHMYVAYCHHHIAHVKLHAGELDAAMDTMKLALAMLERVAGPEHINVATMLATMATIAVHKGDEELGIEQLERALAIEAKVFGADTPQLAVTRQLIATIHGGLGHHGLAEPYLRGAVGSLVPVYQTRLETLVPCLNALILCLRAQGKHREILELSEPLLDRWNEAPDAPPEALAALWNGASEACYRLDKRAQAERFLKQALRGAEARFGREAPELAPLLSNMSQLMRAFGKKAEARYAERRLAEIQGKHN